VFFRVLSLPYQHRLFLMSLPSSAALESRPLAEFPSIMSARLLSSRRS
jgi:hypothetical protein